MFNFFAKDSLAFIGAAWLVLSFSTQAALTAVDLDGNTINGHEGVYDDVLNITWLANANLAASNNFGVAGITLVGGMNWDTAENFITAINSASYLGANTWRLPTSTPLNGSVFDISLTYDGSSDNSYQLSAPVDAIYNPNGQSPGFIGSELAYHYYNNFEAIGSCYGTGSSISGCQSSTVFGIANAQDTEGNKSLFSNIQNSVYWTGTELAADAFNFHTDVGLQDSNTKDQTHFVWAVADGNLAANAVPLPATAWMFGSALLILYGIRSRQPRW